ncbi:unnamed protein product [Paramecium primaurelia]|uniref:Uncharacterized protein n=1 Tax=Paramecium primaurelia TaxID=5886 RepID=A0A8S1L4V0_PARPR|nr:unnamed protein product [Paramecium primaurelia]
MNKDGFEKFDEDITTSRPLEHFHQLTEAPPQKNFNFLVVQKMNVEGPNIIQKCIVKPLQQVGQTAVENTKNAVLQIPQFFKWGASELLNKLQSTFHKSPEDKQPQIEQEQQLQQNQPEESSIDDIPVVFVVPKEIMEGPITERLQWIDQHRNDCEVFIPLEKPLKLNNYNGIHSSSSSSNGPDDFDYEVRRISQEFKLKDNESELFPSTQIMKKKLMESKKRFIMSEEDYKHLNQQNNQNQNYNEPQNIILYPFLGELIPKETILEQIKQYQLEQSSVTVIQSNMEQIQTQQIPQQNENQFNPLILNGEPFENNQQVQQQQQQQQQQQLEKVQERQLEALLEV